MPVLIKSGDFIFQADFGSEGYEKGEQSEMIRSLDKLVKFVGIALIPIGITLCTRIFLQRGASETVLFRRWQFLHDSGRIISAGKRGVGCQFYETGS